MTALSVQLLRSVLFCSLLHSYAACRGTSLRPSRPLLQNHGTWEPRSSTKKVANTVMVRTVEEGSAAPTSA